jgi:hypothetical protein
MSFNNQVRDFAMAGYFADFELLLYIVYNLLATAYFKSGNLSLATTSLGSNMAFGLGEK